MVDTTNIIDLKKRIKKQQETIEEFTQEDINDLTVEGMQKLMGTMNGINKNIGVLFDLVKLTKEATQQNQERIEAIEQHLDKDLRNTRLSVRAMIEGKH